MMILILCTILFSLVLAGLILIPYAKFFKWLNNYINVRCLSFGMLLVIFGFIFKVILNHQPISGDDFLHSYASGIYKISIFIGVICVISSVFIDRIFGEDKKI